MWILYTWSTAVQLHVAQLILSLAYLAWSVAHGASVRRLLWAWIGTVTAFIAAIVTGALQGALMAFALHASLRYFSGELRPVVLFGPWALASTH